MSAAASPPHDPLALPTVPVPAPADHPWRDRAVATLAIVALAVALGGAIKHRHREIATFENRATAAWPAAPRSFAALRAFPRAFEAAFTDRFGGRDRLIELHHASALEIFGVSPVAKVMLGREDWLFFLGEDGYSIDRDYRGVLAYPESEPSRIAAEYKRRSDFLAARGIPYIVVIIPDKHTVYAEYLPPWVTRGHGSSRLDRLYTALHAYPDVTVLDLRPALREAKSRDQVFFKTDSHWNFLGALAGYDVLIAAVKARVPAVPAVPGRRPVYEPGVDFYSGDLSRMVGMPDKRVEDDIAPFAKAVADPQLCARPSDVRPPAAPPPPVEVEVFTCDRPGLPTALVYRDSMAELLMPLLNDNFRRIVYVADRRLDPKLVVEEAPDVVIDEVVERNIHATAYLPM